MIKKQQHKRRASTSSKSRKRLIVASLPVSKSWVSKNVASIAVMFLVGSLAWGAYNLSRAAQPATANSTVPFPGPARDNNGQRSVGHLASIPGVHTPATSLQKVSSLSSTSDNQIIRNVDVAGAISITHSNVTIIDAKMRQLQVASVNDSVRCEWCTIGDPNGIDQSQGGYNGVGQYNFTLYRSDVYGAVDPLKLRAGYAEVRESWIHDAYEWLSDPAQGGESSHSDFLQTVLNGNVSSIKLINNYWDGWVFDDGMSLKSGCTQFVECQVFRDYARSGTATGIISLFQHQTNYRIRSVDITGNVFNGKAYAIFYHTQSNLSDGGKPDSFRVTGNIFHQNAPNYGVNALADFRMASTVQWGCNVNQNGQTVNRSGTQSAANCAVLDLADWGSSAPAQLPDLVIDAISWSPQNPQPGQEVTFSAVVRNQGDGSTPSGVAHKVLFLVEDDSMWSDNVTASLEAGAQRVQTANGGAIKATWTAGTGSFVVTAKLDNANLIPEKDELNNTRTATVVVTDNVKTGDANGDGMVNGLDLSTVLTNYGQAGSSRAQGDVTGDGIVNGLDLSTVLSNYGG